MKTMKTMKKIIKSYDELIKLPSFEERFEYLRLNGTVGEETFGFARYINQSFYHSYEWLRFRDKVIVRDNGCDLGVSGYEIADSIIIHHINPITYDDIVNMNDCVLDFNILIKKNLYNNTAFILGEVFFFVKTFAVRKKNDTCPWKQ
ncbi:MAG: hypothetical protein Q4G33_06835 [bacterium]|nr:hypothetical protein [bacterium]